MSRLALIVSVAALLALPASAGAHSILNGGQGEITYTTEDVTSLNCLVVEDRGSNVYFKDFTEGRNCVDAGINVGGDCSPGNQIDENGYVYDGSCPRANKGLIRIDVGPREDVVNAQISLSIQILGGDGADQITLGNPDDVVLGGPGNDVIDSGGGNDLVKDEDGDDTVVTGPGNDTIQAGRGAETIDAGDGDDDVRVRDGIKDTVVCGAGADKVDADQLDDVAPDCENVQRTQTSPPSGTGGDDDGRPPKLSVGAETTQRIGRRGRFFIAATSSEIGTVAASGRLVVGGLLLPLKTKSKAIRIPGAGARIKVKLGRRAMRQVRRAWKRGKKVHARMDVVATDRAGNSSTRKAPRIRLRR